jgi:protein-S-isoprenylcysteine O-methyltransferase Ste14
MLDAEAVHSSYFWKHGFLFWVYSLLMFLPIIMVFAFCNYCSLDLLAYAGWILLVFRVVLIFMADGEFRKKCGASKGESIVQTKVLVDGGVYAIVRHLQYLGFMLFIFALVLMSQHWINVTSWIAGSTLFYRERLKEEPMNIVKFGDNFQYSMEKVPRLRLLLGIFRLFRRGEVGIGV